MKTYLFIHDVEVNETELIIKIEPLYCAENNSSGSLNISNKDYIPTKGDKLYFLPGVNIPRVKLKDLSLQHGIKTVRDIDQATHVFGGNNTKDKMMTGHWYYSMQTSCLRAILEDPELVMDDYYKENLTQALEFYTEDVVVLEYSSAGQLRNAELVAVKRNILGALSGSSVIYHTPDPEHMELFPGIMLYMMSLQS